MNSLSEIKKSVYQALEKCYGLVSEQDVVLDHPTIESHGDYSTNIALRLSKELGKPPREIAEDLLAELKKVKDPVWEKVEIAGPARLPAGQGFINFFIKKEVLICEVEIIVSDSERYGRLKLTDKKIMVEFAHPNTHKQFHIGHLRNITLGESVVRLLEATGNNVVRANYQGDVGMHVAKAIWGVRQKISDYEKAKTASVKDRVEFLAKAYVAGNQAYESDPAAKEEIIVINKQIYGKDPAVLGLWQETRQWSLDYFDLIYKRVGTTFDRFYFESEVAARGKELVLANVGKVFAKSDGAVVYHGEKAGLHTRVFINSEGNPTYEAKDIGLAEIQFTEHHPDLIIHNVGPEQTGYFEVIFAAITELFPEFTGKEKHLAYGWVKLKEGKMSSRTGNVVLGEWLLDEIKKKLAEKYSGRMSDLEAVAVGAAKYSLLKVGTSQEIAFDIEESVSLDGDSGPYLQYTYARAKSVLRKAGERELTSKLVNSFIRGKNQLTNQQINQLTPEEISILRYLYRFPEVVEAAARTYSPNLVCSYLFELAKKYNNLYNNIAILGSKEEKFLLALTGATAQVLANGLRLLGISALEKM